MTSTRKGERVAVAGRSSPTVVPVNRQRVPAARLAAELAKVTDRREPAVPVEVWLGIDARWWDGELHGWAPNPHGADGSLRGLVIAPREYSPGFWSEYIGWVTPDRLRQR